ncbi:hypothetical protein [Hoyosella altamirensis]|uniref:Uncharacterized protein n=1 Tax=Hoyosella altamirensis TaxID=616997 RepID=A0A839RRW2_9ACTN|nr:hypothetical protein [Hoyosella altamirensis]MBB3039595.1 hypothetical protein [Hoyosella altamirensis]
MAADSQVSDGVKLAAIKDALDRAGVSARTAVDVNVDTKPWEQLMANVAGLRGGSRAASRTRRGADDTGPAGPQHGTLGSPGEVLEAEVLDDDSDDGEPPSCKGCGGVFPSTLPPWLIAYPTYCQDCRAERGLPDPPRNDTPALDYDTENPPRSAQNAVDNFAPHPSATSGVNVALRGATAPAMAATGRRNRGVCPPVAGSTRLGYAAPPRARRRTKA